MLGVVIVAAGSGTRLGHSEPKAFVQLAGETLLERAIRGARASAEPIDCVVAVPAHLVSAARELIAAAALEPVTVVAGGVSRQASVAAGLAALSPEVDVVLVHDAARPLVPGEVFDRVAAAVRRTGGGAIPATRVVNTLKRVAPGGQHVPLDDEPVLAAVDRAELVAAQTPQGFPRRALDEAYTSASAEHSDDAALFAAAGGSVVVVDGASTGFKITGPADLRRAGALLAGRDARVGVGVDIHAFDDTLPLWLGGLLWEGEPGLAGHSDGDALLHAICDALLGAAGLGDLGTNFGVDDPRYAGAPSVEFLRASLEKLDAAGFDVGNVSVQIVAERPRVAPRRAELEQRLTDLVGAPVTVSGTTADGIGVIGAGEGIQAVAVALIVPR